jgi:hypothetical protein
VQSKHDNEVIFSMCCWPAGYGWLAPDHDSRFQLQSWQYSLTNHSHALI